MSIIPIIMQVPSWSICLSGSKSTPTTGWHDCYSNDILFNKNYLSCVSTEWDDLCNDTLNTVIQYTCIVAVTVACTHTHTTYLSCETKCVCVWGVPMLRLLSCSCMHLSILCPTPSLYGQRWGKVGIWLLLFLNAPSPEQCFQYKNCYCAKSYSSHLVVT